ncbi:meprin A subunit alpha-like [Homarus americanus]|uniref:meprin A subunit alpha-like n=1 Tax=Homarus americanus TaxID=6706 RepID=UPI001C485BE7|nr:meprin A subunit alpha-like [Homarus americanus]
MWYLSIHSCVRFIEIQSDEEVHRVMIKPSKGSCSTNIGYKPDTLTFRQLFLVGPSCTVSKWHLMHQILLLAGLYPEQRHYNRVRYLLVDMEAIQQDHHLEYAKLKGAFGFLMTLGLPYDPTSLLHYNNNIFSVDDNIQTMLLKVKEFNGTLGQREDFSATDRARLNRLYMCWGHYLGDDLPGAVPYLYWFNTFLSP